jgi:hypothetical protein
MTINASLEILSQDVSRQIESVRLRVARDKGKATNVAVYVGLVSAVTTISIGTVGFLPKDYEKAFGILSLLASASTTVLLAWDGIFHHKKLWISAVATLNELRSLETDIKHVQTAEQEGSTQDQVNQLYSRFKEILNSTNERWQKIRE